MSDCSQHKKDVAGISDMKVLAEMIGDLHYESLAELLDCLADKLFLDAAQDRVSGKKSLAAALDNVANLIYNAHVEAEIAWEISQPSCDHQLNKTM